MPRYIDADALYKATEKRIKEANSYRMAVVDGEFLDLINDAFTEDVVPKSEAEARGGSFYIKLNEAINSANQFIKEHDAEVAREIFEEIEDVLNNLGYFDEIDFKALKKKYLPDTNDGDKVSSHDICVVCGESVPEGRQVCGMCETGQEFLKKRKGDDVG